MRAHPPETKRKAKPLYEQHGAFEAGRRLSIPARTIREWARLDGWTRKLPPPRPAPAPPPPAEKRPKPPPKPPREPRERDHSAEVRLSWTTRRRQLADRTGEVAAKLLEALARELDAERSPGRLRDAAIAYGVLVDKAGELSALVGASEGPEVPEPERNARITEMVELWQERKEAADG